MFLEKKLEKTPNSICGMDVSYTKDIGVGAAVVLSYPDLKLLNSIIVKDSAFIPYVPTFLAFREMPFLFKLFKRVKADLFMINGHGIAHPRGCGIATQFGVAFKVPTIGIARGLLKGLKLKEDYIMLNGRIVGKKINNFYVSVGNMITLEEVIEITIKCIKNSMPEPIKLAHEFSRRELYG
ncbi:MAG: endonuclease V [Candidatus Methanomethyliaceae archaeon]|nr:endonuclease V [Candidatus Methanomethyliaceae archaeon]